MGVPGLVCCEQASPLPVLRPSGRPRGLPVWPTHRHKCCSTPRWFSPLTTHSCFSPVLSVLSVGRHAVHSLQRRAGQVRCNAHRVAFRGPSSFAGAPPHDRQHPHGTDLLSTRRVGKRSRSTCCRSFRFSTAGLSSRPHDGTFPPPADSIPATEQPLCTHSHQEATICHVACSWISPRHSKARDRSGCCSGRPCPSWIAILPATFLSVAHHSSPLYRTIFPQDVA